MAYSYDVPVLHQAQPGPTRWIRTLARLVLLIGVIGGIAGVSYAVNALTIVPATVRAPVTLLAPEGSWPGVELSVDGLTFDDASITTLPPTALWTGSTGGQVTIEAWGSTHLEQFLSRGNALVGGLALTVGAILVYPVLLSISTGSPFATGNARRFTLLAFLIAVAGTLIPLLPQLAGLLMLDRLGLADDGIFATAVPSLSLEPLLVAALVLAFAAAFRAGEQLVRDTDGLV